MTFDRPKRILNVMDTPTPEFVRVLVYDHKSGHPTAVEALQT
jgi:hypothetical protein